jgi:heptosyltransferase II
MMKLNIPACKNFSGYKPCYSYKNCLEDGCQNESVETAHGEMILIISLDAMGNVLDNSAILPAIKRKFPVSTIYWVTMPSAVNILKNIKYIDRVFTWNDESRMILRNIKFDYLFNADKSDYASAFANEVNAKVKKGFILNEYGKIIPANEGALYSYILGNDDELKFRKNKRSGIDILHEAFELEWRNDEYTFELTDDEKAFAKRFKDSVNYNPDKTYVGLNTGCADLFPNKKMTIEQHMFLINELVMDDSLQVVLLGGPEDTERNKIIFDSLSPGVRKKVIDTPTTEGLRKGAAYMDLCDIVISGDSFGMHLAIALKKYVIAWFGLSCAAEIELYGRGAKLTAESLSCSPCWKKVCPYNLECISMIDLKKMIDLVKEYHQNNKSKILVI